MPDPPNRRPLPGIRTGDAAGFALIITLSLMILLVIVAVGLLTLSSIALRSTSSGNATQVARANARMAMILAIGELQKTAGADTRATATAEAVAGANGSRYVTGVWRSWEGNDHDKSTGLPVAPDYGSKLVSGKLGIESTEAGRFLGWMVSGARDNNDARNPPSISSGNGTVPLLSGGTLGKGTNAEVHLKPNSMAGGAYAWWVQGENSKVQLKPVEAPKNKFESTEQMVVSPSPSGAEYHIDDTKDVNRAATRGSLDLVASGAPADPQPSEFFHDLTVSAKGLLTNNANGGWKRDISIFSENFSQIPEGFSSFTLSPGKDQKSGKTNQGSATNPLIYGWSNWSKNPFQNSVSWAALADFATSYKRQLSSGDPAAKFTDSTTYQQADANQQWEMTDTVRVVPVLARVHTVISLSSQKINETSYRPSVVLNPVITMWNPYSVAIDMSWTSSLRVNLTMGSPFNVTFDLDNTKVTKSVSALGVDTINIPTGTPSSVWLPGEVRTFSPTGDVRVADQTNTLNYSVGCNPSGGVRYRISGLNDSPGTTKLAATDAVLKAIHNGPNVQGTGVYYTLKRASSRIGNPPNTANMSSLLDDLENAKSMMGEDLQLTGVSGTLESLSQDNGARPFLSVVTSMRFARDVNDGMTDITVNGIHQMNPAVGYMVGSSTSQASTPLAERMDVYPYNVLLFSVNSYSDPSMPAGLSGSPEGYVGSGFRADDGLSNLVLLEVPTRPLRMIGDLQHFNVNKCNSWPPYTLNALGNSRASSFIASDEVLVSGVSQSERLIGHDHSYAVNHVLLDDWFVSSVAPEVNEWSASVARDAQKVYADHLSGQKALPNHYYKPQEATDNSTTAASKFLADPDAWMKIAAELEVDGMFNINSTSERAWSMLLKKNFGEDEGGVLVLQNAGAGSGSANTSLEQSDGTPFPRSTLISAADGGGLTSLSQHLRFDDKQIEALAQEIVVEIKKRGPFLSLSEFFNRQLSRDANLAKAGAVESALHRLSEGTGSENPFKKIQGDFRDQASNVNARNQPGPLNWPFSEAAKGNMAYGFPGWTRQADVLRSVSGILSARDDTFTIRAYGDARDADGKILSNAWCEVVVRRSPEYVDRSSPGGDDKYVLPGETTLKSEANKRFGRRFEIIQFRWLNATEV